MFSAGLTEAEDGVTAVEPGEDFRFLYILLEVMELI